MKACVNFIRLNKYIPPMLCREVRDQILKEVKNKDIFHNHYDDGSYIYRYPHIQYKIICGKICILGIGDGAEEVANLKIPYKNGI